MQEQAPTRSKLRQARVHNRLLDFARAGWADITEGIANWRMWHLLGSADLRQRYVRSRLGQFWLTLSTGILIGSLGLVWSLLWNVPVSEMMPYLAISIVLWNVLTGIIGDATMVFVKSGRYFINQKRIEGLLKDDLPNVSPTGPVLIEAAIVRLRRYEIQESRLAYRWLTAPSSR
jgi:hypothetical protein